MAAEEPGPSEEVELMGSNGRRSARRLMSFPKANEACSSFATASPTDDQPETIEQVVRHLHISRNRVRRLEEHGLARLGERREVQGLRR